MTADDSTQFSRTVERYLRSSGDSTQYRDTAETVLTQFAEWLRRRDLDAFESFERDGERIVRRYADRLNQRVEADGIAASTAQMYYNVVSGFLGFCVRDGVLSRNPATTDRAREPLPRDDQDRAQQFWTPEVRRRLVEHTNDAAYDAIDENGLDAMREAQNRAFVHVLAYTGVRGAEVFRVSGDDREGRRGLTWSRVDRDSWTFRVWGKSQSWEDVSVLEQARDAIESWYRIQDPPTDEWPVFPTNHAPSKYAAVRETREDAEDVLADADVDEVLREYEIAPPAITTHGARKVLSRIAEDADADVDGEVPKLHGARRGLGDTLFRKDRGLASDILRHSSLSVTKEAYSHIDAAERGDAASELLDE